MSMYKRSLLKAFVKILVLYSNFIYSCFMQNFLSNSYIYLIVIIESNLRQTKLSSPEYVLLYL